MLETSCSLPYNQIALGRRNVSEDAMPFHLPWLYTDGVLKSCADNSNCGFSRLPATFTDGFHWIGQGQERLEPCDGGKRFLNNSHMLLQSLGNLWTWNSRLREYSDACVDDDGNSLAATIKRRAKQILLDGLDLHGRRLFPLELMGG
jgi:hypothetical protein